MFGKRQVFLLFSPLGLAETLHLDDISWRAVQHWAIQVGEKDDSRVFEVARDGDGTPEYRNTSRRDWVASHTHFNFRHIGDTSCSDKEIDRRCKIIWQEVYNRKYRVFTTNCQTFANILLPWIFDETRPTIRHLPPPPINPALAVPRLIKQAKAAAEAKRSKIFGGSIANSGGSSNVPKKDEKIPRRPSSTWLASFLQEVHGKDIGNKSDFRAAVRATNTKLRA